MLVNKIQNHDTFKDIPQRQQNPVEKQLAVVLYKLGGKGTVWDICTKFGIAEGTVSSFTSRVVEALKSLKMKFGHMEIIVKKFTKVLRICMGFLT